MSTTARHGLESERVADWLRNGIIFGAWSPGSRLIERELAAKAGVSRLPVRVALKALEAEGLVELRPRTWARVREFTDADFADLDEIREVLEPMAFRLAAQRHDDAGLERLRRMLNEEQLSSATFDDGRSKRAAADFHEIVVELSENRLLAELMGTIRSRLRLVLAQHDDAPHFAAEHQAMFEAIRDRDSERAAQLAFAHIAPGTQKRQEYRSALRAHTAPPTTS